MKCFPPLVCFIVSYALVLSSFVIIHQVWPTFSLNHSLFSPHSNISACSLCFPAVLFFNHSTHLTICCVSDTVRLDNTVGEANHSQFEKL